MILNIKKLKKIYQPFLLPFVILFLGTLLLFYTETLAQEFIQEELTIPILTYHKFCLGDSPDAYTINIDRFEQQMNYLKKNGYEVITVSQLLQCMENHLFPDKPVIITIDDGFRSVFTLAFPVLKKYQFPATLYLYTNFIAKGANQLSWQEIKEMMDHGIEIGSHSISHCNLLHIKKNESPMDYLKRINDELSLSKEILEKNTGSPVLSFSYPYGVYSQQIKMLAKQAGYQALLNTNSMNNTIPLDAYSLNRQIISASCTMKQFESLLHERPLHVNDVFPADGTITSNQAISVGAILDDSRIQPETLYFRLSGSGLLDYTYNNEMQKISFTPVAPKLLQKRTWIAQITALDRENGYRRKVSWLFTVE